MRKLTPEQLRQIHHRDEVVGLLHDMTIGEADAAVNDRAALLKHITALEAERDA